MAKQPKVIISNKVKEMDARLLEIEKIENPALEDMKEYAITFGYSARLLCLANGLDLGDTLSTIYQEMKQKQEG